MAFTVVQVAHGGFTFGGTSGTAVFGSNVTSGNSIVVAWGFRETSNQVVGAYTVSITDSVSSSYTKQVSQAFFDGASRNHVEFIYSAPVGGSGANTVTVSVTAGLTAANCKGGAIFVWEVSGLSSNTAEATGTNATNTNANNPVIQTSSNLTWTDDPFVVAFIDSNSNTSTYTPTAAAFSTVKDESQNTSFGAIYNTVPGALTSPTNCQVTLATTAEAAVSEIAAAFPGGIPPSVFGFENQGPPPKFLPFHRLAQLDEQWARTLVLQPPWGWDNQGPPPKPLPFHRLEQHFERWPNTAVGGLPNHFAWWYDQRHLLPPRRLWRAPSQQIEIFYPIIPPPNLVTQLGWENQGPPPQRLPFHRLVQLDEMVWPFTVVATPTQFGWEIQANPPIRVPFHRLPQLSETWPFATVAITPTQFGWEIQGSPPLRIPFHRLPQVDGYPPGGQTPGPPFLAYGYLRALKVG